MSARADRLLHEHTIQSHPDLAATVNRLYEVALDHGVTFEENRIAKCLLRAIYHYDRQAATHDLDTLTAPQSVNPAADTLSLDLLLAAAPDGMLANRNGWLSDELLDLLAAEINPTPGQFVLKAAETSRFITHTEGVSNVDRLNKLISQAHSNRDDPAADHWEVFIGTSMPDDINVVHAPINTGSHWIHAVFAMTGSDGSISVYDSGTDLCGTVAGGRPFQQYDVELPLVVELMRLRPNSDWVIIDWLTVPVEAMDCADQGNTSDCGPKVLSSILRAMTGMPEMTGLEARMYFLGRLMRHFGNLPAWANDEINAHFRARALHQRQQQLVQAEFQKQKELQQKLKQLKLQQKQTDQHQQTKLPFKIDKPDAGHNGVAHFRGLRPSDIDRGFQDWLRGQNLPSDPEVMKLMESAYRAAAALQPTKVYPHAVVIIDDDNPNRKYFATGDHVGSVATGSILTSKQYNVSRPHWTSEEDEKLLKAFEEGKTDQQIAVECFAEERTSAAVQARRHRIYQNEQQEAQREEMLALDPTLAPTARQLQRRGKNLHDPSLLAEGQATFNQNQARFFFSLKAGWRSYDKNNSHMVFRYAEPSASDLSDIAEVLADFRFAYEESRRVIPKAQHARTMPFHVVVSQAINSFQSQQAGAYGAAMHDWQLGEMHLEHVFYFTTSVCWTIERCIEWRSLTLYSQMRCSDSRIEYMWSDPDTQVLAVTVLLAKENEGGGKGTYTVTLTLAQTSWEAAQADAGSGSLVLLCFPNRVVTSTLAALAKCTERDIGGPIEYSNGTVSLTFDLGSPQFAAWSGSRYIPMDGLSHHLLDTLRRAHLLASHGLLVGTRLETWANVSARLYPGQ